MNIDYRTLPRLIPPAADEMHKICYESRHGNFLSGIQRTVDGAVLDSRDERDEDCVITFQTESVVEKFLLKFERLQMDCNDHLYIYDGAHVAGPERVRFDAPILVYPYSLSSSISPFPTASKDQQSF